MAIPFVCTNPTCGKTFEVFPYQIKNGRKFCCASCMAAVNGPKLRTKVEVLCNNSLCRKPFLAKPFDIQRGGGKYCSIACAPLGRIARDVSLRFWEKVLVCSHGLDCVFCCWEWQGGRHRYGYGFLSVKVDGVWKDIGSHRVAWEILNQQPLPKGMDALHYCDHPPCNNGMHIHPGTHKQNMQEASQRSRWANQTRLRGEESPVAKLTETEVLGIRRMRAQGCTFNEIQQVYPRPVATISSIVTRRSWKHLP